MTKQVKSTKKKSKSSYKNVVLILEVIYLLQTILATITTINKDNVSFIQIMWWPYLINILLIINYILYIKKEKMGILFELIIGLMMLIKVFIAMLINVPDMASLLLMSVYPLILIIHSLKLLKKMSKKSANK